MENKILLVFALLLLYNFTYSQTEYTAIPDANFEKALSQFDDIPEDGQVPTANISSLQTLSVNSKQITNLTGIQDFVALKELSCRDNNLTQLNLTNNINLEQLFCHQNQIQELDLSKNNKLIDLNCSDNTSTKLNFKNGANHKIVSVNFRKNEDLLCILIDNEEAAINGLDTYLNWNKDSHARYAEDCNADVTDRYTIIPDPFFEKELEDFDNINGRGDGLIPTVNIQNIKILELNDNRINDLMGIEAFKELEELDCSFTEIEILDLSNNLNIHTLKAYSSKLNELNILNNTQLKELDVHRNKLTTLNLSSNTKLEILNCDENELGQLDISKNTFLKELSCFSNKIQQLDVSKNILLEKLSCSSNQIQQLNVSKNTELSTLSCRRNGLKELDLTSNSKLRLLFCTSNELQQLDISANPELNTLLCSGNKLETLDLSNNPKLMTVFCTANELKKLNTSNNSTSFSYTVKATNNPDLNCIQVDDQEAANNGTGIYENWEKDNIVSYSENCDALGIQDYASNNNLQIYPNPSRGIFNISGDININKVEVFDAQGNSIQTFDLRNTTSKNIDVSNLFTGMYFLTIYTQNSVVTKKVLIN